MKYILLALGFVIGASAFMPVKADAYVCGRGAYRSGCAGPNGAVVRRHPPYAAPRGVYVAPRPAYVSPRPVYVAPARHCAWVNGVRVCR